MVRSRAQRAGESEDVAQPDPTQLAALRYLADCAEDEGEGRNEDEQDDESVHESDADFIDDRPESEMSHAENDDDNRQDESDDGHTAKRSKKKRKRLVDGEGNESEDDAAEPKRSRKKTKRFVQEDDDGAVVFKPKKTKAGKAKQSKKPKEPKPKLARGQRIGGRPRTNPVPEFTLPKRPVGRPRQDGTPAGSERVQATAESVDDGFIGPAAPVYLDGSAISTDVHLRYYSVTIAVRGTDIDVNFNRERMRKFMDMACAQGAYAVERGSQEFRLHFQCVFAVRIPTSQSLRKHILRALGWINKQTTPPNATLKVTELNGKGVHTWIGMLGYVQKDRHEPHFELHTRGVSDDELREGLEEYALFGSVTKNRSVLGKTNLMDRMEMYYIYRSRDPEKHAENPVSLITEMLQTGRYVPDISWSMHSGHFDTSRALQSLWRVRMDPEMVEDSDVMEIFFPVLPALHKTTASFRSGADAPDHRACPEVSATPADCDPGNSSARANRDLRQARDVLQSLFRPQGGAAFAERMERQLRRFGALGAVNEPVSRPVATSQQSGTESAQQPVQNRFNRGLLGVWLNRNPQPDPENEFVRGDDFVHVPDVQSSAQSAAGSGHQTPRQRNSQDERERTEHSNERSAAQSACDSGHQTPRSISGLMSAIQATPPTVQRQRHSDNEQRRGGNSGHETPRQSGGAKDIALQQKASRTLSWARSRRGDTLPAQAETIPVRDELTARTRSFFDRGNGPDVSVQIDDASNIVRQFPSTSASRIPQGLRGLFRQTSESRATHQDHNQHHDNDKDNPDSTEPE